MILITGSIIVSKYEKSDLTNNKDDPVKTTLIFV